MLRYDFKLGDGREKSFKKTRKQTCFFKIMLIWEKGSVKSINCKIDGR